MTLDEIREPLAAQGFRIFRDQNTGDYIIADSDYSEVARQPPDQEILRDTVIVALTFAGLFWPEQGDST